MIEAGNCSCFTDEALHPFRIGCDRGRQEFYGDRAIQLTRVLGKVDLAHATRADMRADFVTPQFYTFTKWHCEQGRLKFVSRLLNKFLRRIYVLGYFSCVSIERDY